MIAASFTAFTRRGETHYALLRLPEGGPLPEEFLVPWPRRVSRVTLLSRNEALPFRPAADGLLVRLPPLLSGEESLAPALRLDP